MSISRIDYVYGLVDDEFKIISKTNSPYKNALIIFEKYFNLALESLGELFNNVAIDLTVFEYYKQAIVRQAKYKNKSHNQPKTSLTFERVIKRYKKLTELKELTQKIINLPVCAISNILMEGNLQLDKVELLNSQLFGLMRSLSIPFELISIIHQSLDNETVYFAGKLALNNPDNPHIKVLLDQADQGLVSLNPMPSIRYSSKVVIVKPAQTQEEKINSICNKLKSELRFLKVSEDQIEKILNIIDCSTEKKAKINVALVLLICTFRPNVLLNENPSWCVFQEECEKIFQRIESGIEEKTKHFASFRSINFDEYKRTLLPLLFAELLVTPSSKINSGLCEILEKRLLEESDLRMPYERSIANGIEKLVWDEGIKKQILKARIPQMTNVNGQNMIRASLGLAQEVVITPIHVRIFLISQLLSHCRQHNVPLCAATAATIKVKEEHTAIFIKHLIELVRKGFITPVNNPNNHYPFLLQIPANISDETIYVDESGKIINQTINEFYFQSLGRAVLRMGLPNEKYSFRATSGHNGLSNNETLEKWIQIIGEWNLPESIGHHLKRTFHLQHNERYIWDNPYLQRAALGMGIPNLKYVLKPYCENHTGLSKIDTLKKWVQVIARWHFTDEIGSDKNENAFLVERKTNLGLYYLEASQAPTGVTALEHALGEVNYYGNREMKSVFKKSLTLNLVGHPSQLIQSKTSRLIDEFVKELSQSSKFILDTNCKTLAGDDKTRYVLYNTINQLSWKPIRNFKEYLLFLVQVVKKITIDFLPTSENFQARSYLLKGIAVSLKEIKKHYKSNKSKDNLPWLYGPGACSESILREIIPDYNPKIKVISIANRSEFVSEILRFYSLQIGDVFNFSVPRMHISTRSHAFNVCLRHPTLACLPESPQHVDEWIEKSILAPGKKIAESPISPQLAADWIQFMLGQFRGFDEQNIENDKEKFLTKIESLSTGLSHQEFRSQILKIALEFERIRDMGETVIQNRLDSFIIQKGLSRKDKEIWQKTLVHLADTNWSRQNQDMHIMTGVNLGTGEIDIYFTNESGKNPELYTKDNFSNKSWYLYLEV